MRIILDTNVWISFLIGHQLQMVRSIVTDIRFEVFVCPQLTKEIVDVAGRDKIRRYIQDGDVEDLMRIIRAFCHAVNVTNEAESDIRDKKDLYLLSLAEEVDAAYIVSGDADLTVLQQHKNTRIITFSEFKNQVM